MRNAFKRGPTPEEQLAILRQQSLEDHRQHQQAFEEQQALIRKLRNEHDAITRELRDHARTLEARLQVCDSHEDQIFHLSSRVKELDLEIVGHFDLRNKLEEEMAQLKRASFDSIQLEKLAHINWQLKSDNSELTSANSQLASDQTRLQTELEEIRQQHALLQQQTQSFTDEIERVKAANDALTKERHEAVALSNLLDAELQQQSRQRQAVDDAFQECRTLRSQIASLEESNAALLAEKETREKMQETINKLETELRSVREQQQKQQEEAASREQSLLEQLRAQETQPEPTATALLSKIAEVQARMGETGSLLSVRLAATEHRMGAIADLQQSIGAKMQCAPPPQVSSEPARLQQLEFLAEIEEAIAECEAQLLNC